MLAYYGGTVYGKSAHNPNVVAETRLGIYNSVYLI